ncbi:hypothetical protein DSM106972_072650 [Dulcicalothrix desertica PCC 7102]|uniref:Uncharacterized protein n=2 Tax=Dulcicalothrix desertica TaxID=32056 RepID=A0A433V438_9CYAN|nr:hypothetical protein [Dulcicalothrix desertica]RUT00856.1 hypothetical protein DSM106972_072650 [Dulcicalothrix desertica PCC 7102]TWH42307.1 hypothetical protein CAL7102_05947 [Dulcicalothrix desertica PCC 7102]
MEFQVDEATFYGVLGHDSFALMFPMQGEKHWRLVGNLPEYNDQVDQDVTNARARTPLYSTYNTNSTNSTMWILVSAVRDHTSCQTPQKAISSP